MIQYNNDDDTVVENNHKNKDKYSDKKIMLIKYTGHTILFIVVLYIVVL